LKKSDFSYLFSKQGEAETPLPTRNAKQMVFVLFLFFLLFYFKYKPYDSLPHTIVDFSEYILVIYHFIINQTLGIVHEGGHGVCYILPCPQFITVLNGSLFQWIFPLGIAYYYRKRGNKIAWYMGLFMFGISMDYTAWYMSTAPEGAIVPASKSFLGVDGLHDFHYLFTQLGVLKYASLIAGMTKLIAHLVMIGAVVAMFLHAFSNEGERKR